MLAGTCSSCRAGIPASSSADALSAACRDRATGERRGAARGLATAVTTNLLAIQERFAGGADAHEEAFDGIDEMLHAALDALRKRAARTV
jgi:hypothetical protein